MECIILQTTSSENTVIPTEILEVDRAIDVPFIESLLIKKCFKGRNLAPLAHLKDIVLFNNTTPLELLTEHNILDAKVLGYVQDDKSWSFASTEMTFMELISGIELGYIDDVSFIHIRDPDTIRSRLLIHAGNHSLQFITTP